MPYEYNKSDTYDEASRAELVDSANRGNGGSGAIVEAMFRLMDSNDRQAKATNKLNVVLVVLTVAIAILTFVLVWQGWAQPPTRTIGRFLPLPQLEGAALDTTTGHACMSVTAASGNKVDQQHPLVSCLDVK
jgi:hypothetical protein